MLIHSDRKWAVLCRAVLHFTTGWRRRESKVRQNTSLYDEIFDFSKAFQARDFFFISNFFSGLGPGGFRKGRDSSNYQWKLGCIPGSSHGGIAQAQSGKKPYSGPTYDQQDTVSLLGGSGGEINYLITCMDQIQ